MQEHEPATLQDPAARVLRRFRLVFNTVKTTSGRSDERGAGIPLGE